MKLHELDIVRGKIILKEKGISDPTDSQIATEFLREFRDGKLSQSDWMANSDVTMSEEWKNYRQELRDLPANSNPVLDDELDMTGVTWPTQPE